MGRTIAFFVASVGLWLIVSLSSQDALPGGSRDFASSKQTLPESEVTSRTPLINRNPGRSQRMEVAAITATPQGTARANRANRTVEGRAQAVRQRELESEPDGDPVGAASGASSATGQGLTKIVILGNGPGQSDQRAVITAVGPARAQPQGLNQPSSSAQAGPLARRIGTQSQAAVTPPRIVVAARREAHREQQRVAHLAEQGAPVVQRPLEDPRRLPVAAAEDVRAPAKNTAAVKVARHDDDANAADASKTNKTVQPTTPSTRAVQANSHGGASSKSAVIPKVVRLAQHYPTPAYVGAAGPRALVSAPVNGGTQPVSARRDSLWVRSRFDGQ